MISSFHNHFGNFSRDFEKTTITAMYQQQHRYQAYPAGQTVPSRAEGNNTKCVGKKRFNGSVTHGLRKEHVQHDFPLSPMMSSFHIHFGKFVP
jgi:hypothetical protein